MAIVLILAHNNALWRAFSVVYVFEKLADNNYGALNRKYRHFWSLEVRNTEPP